jgi:hypothetical protein
MDPEQVKRAQLSFQFEKSSPERPAELRLRDEVASLEDARLNRARRAVLQRLTDHGFRSPNR